MGDTTIEWTTKTWNPTRGCSLASPGCTNCYAMRQAHRYSTREGSPYFGLTRKREKGGPVWTGDVRLVPSMLDAPVHWRAPEKVFVNSMSDLFHESLLNEEIAAVFGVMAACPRHTFQVLTKRAKRMREWFEWMATDPIMRMASAIRPLLGEEVAHRAAYNRGDVDVPAWPLPNVWLGVSVEDQRFAEERLPDLLATPATVRFVSYEPALGPVDFRAWIGPPTRHACNAWDGSLRCAACNAGVHAKVGGLHWIIVGGESGPGARPFDLRWAIDVSRQCAVAGVAYFFKQAGKLLALDGEPAWEMTGKGGDEDELRDSVRSLDVDLDVLRREFPRGVS